MSADAPAGAGGGPRLLQALLLAVVVFRLACLGLYPLMDTSEARYGEIARVMVQTGDWVTPQETPGTPFWAKPPLSTWLSAAGIELFGVNEFALRLPSWLCALGVLALCFSWARALGTAPAATGAWLALGLLVTSTGFFAGAGAVMTDPSLALCTTAMLVAFQHAVVAAQPGRAWGLVFFAAAGLGMLAKGPVIVVYAGAPILLWTLWQRRLGDFLHRLPWVRGVLLAALLCVPWYVLAELHTPGFLRYFLVGEHFMRFLHPGWQGDLYGNAHAEPPGTIWLFLLGALGPGWLVLEAALAGTWHKRRPQAAADAGLAARRFALLAGLVPIAFFTVAGNIIWTYALPALGPLAVLAGARLAPAWEGSARWRRCILGCLAASAALLAGAWLFFVPAHVRSHSSADLVARWHEQGGAPAGDILYLGRKAPASLRFYAQGAVRGLPDLAQLLAEAPAGRACYLALAPDWVPQAQAAAGELPGGAAWEEIARNKDLVLVRLVRRRA